MPKLKLVEVIRTLSADRAVEIRAELSQRYENLILARSRLHKLAHDMEQLKNLTDDEKVSKYKDVHGSTTHADFNGVSIPLSDLPKYIEVVEREYDKDNDVAKYIVTELKKRIRAGMYVRIEPLGDIQELANKWVESKIDEMDKLMSVLKERAKALVEQIDELDGSLEDNQMETDDIIECLRKF